MIMDIGFIYTIRSLDQLMYEHKKIVHIHFHVIYVFIQKFSYFISSNLYEPLRDHIKNQHNVEYVVLWVLIELFYNH